MYYSSTIVRFIGYRFAAHLIYYYLDVAFLLQFFLTAVALRWIAIICGLDRCPLHIVGAQNANTMSHEAHSSVIFAKRKIRPFSSWWRRASAFNTIHMHRHKHRAWRMCRRQTRPRQSCISNWMGFYASELTTNGAHLELILDTAHCVLRLFPLVGQMKTKVEARGMVTLMAHLHDTRKRSVVLSPWLSMLLLLFIPDRLCIYVYGMHAVLQYRRSDCFRILYVEMCVRCPLRIMHFRENGLYNIDSWRCNLENEFSIMITRVPSVLYAYTKLDFRT